MQLVPKEMVELKKTGQSIYNFVDSMNEVFSPEEQKEFLNLYKGLLSILGEQILSCSQNCKELEDPINEAGKAQLFLKEVVEEIEKF